MLRLRALPVAAVAGVALVMAANAHAAVLWRGPAVTRIAADAASVALVTRAGPAPSGACATVQLVNARTRRVVLLAGRGSLTCRATPVRASGPSRSRT